MMAIAAPASLFLGVTIWHATLGQLVQVSPEKDHFFAVLLGSLFLGVGVVLVGANRAPSHKPAVGTLIVVLLWVLTIVSAFEVLRSGTLEYLYEFLASAIAGTLTLGFIAGQTVKRWLGVPGSRVGGAGVSN
jgi:hypothetical protein